MPRIPKFLNPWKVERDEQRRRFELLRQRDGDNCRRCRRPMRFDLPRGDAQAPIIEHLGRRSKGRTPALDDLCLCHGRCNRDLGDNTGQVQERLRARADAAPPSAPVARRKRNVA